MEVASVLSFDINIVSFFFLPDWRLLALLCFSSVCLTLEVVAGNMYCNSNGCGEIYSRVLYVQMREAFMDVTRQREMNVNSF